MAAGWTEAIGLVGGGLTTISFLPQAVKVYRTRSTRDISLGMFALAWFGMVLWLIYGLYLDSAALIICNGMTLFLSGFIILYKLRYG
jgi:MtN3 and saliva related transmembrane protein